MKEPSAILQSRISLKLNMSAKQLNSILYNSNFPRKFYYIKKLIPKKDGSHRQIHAVTGKLKVLQTRTHNWLKKSYQPTRYATGFVPNKSIIDNAMIHRNKKVIISFDIKDFFPSISFARVLGMFKKYPFSFSNEWSITLAQICCLDELNGSIAQGAVTSPYISNMLCRKLDKRLASLAVQQKMHFSRYADDMTFSTNKNISISDFIQYVENIVDDEGFSLNQKKTRVMMKHHRQVVTGIIVNQGLNVNRKYIMNTKALIHNCLKKGIDGQIVKSDFIDIRDSCSPFYKISSGFGHYKYKRYAKVKRVGIELIKTDNEDSHTEEKINDPLKINFITKEYNEKIEVPMKITYARMIFLRHIGGRVKFIKQVINANENLDGKLWLKRKKIYEKLEESFKTLLLKNETKIELNKYRNIFFYNSKNEKKEQEKEHLVKVKTTNNINELKNYINKKKIIDARYYTENFDDTNIEKLRNKILKLEKYMPPDKKKVENFLDKMEDSTGSIFGKIVHFENISYVDLKEFSKDFSLNYEFRFPTDLRTIINNLIKNLYSLKHDLIVKNDNVEILNLEDKKIQESIIKVKKKLRFQHKDSETGTILLEELKKIRDEFLNSPLYTKNITIEFDLKYPVFNTCVESVISSLREILKSMYRHTEEGHDIIISAEKDKSDNCVNLTINSNQQYSYDEKHKLDREWLSHGKLKKSIKHLNGLCDYSIYVLDSRKWKKFNMFNGNDIQDADIEGLKSFTHQLKFK